MEIHFFSKGFASFAGVDEFSAESEAEADVVAAAAPLPDADVGGGGGAGAVRRAVDVRVVAGAGLDGALGTRAGHCVRHARTCYRINEGRFAATYNNGNVF